MIKKSITKNFCDHGGELRQYFAVGETDFVRCLKCEMVLRHPMPSLEELDLIYANLYRRDRISQLITNQESGSYALKQYAKFLNAYLSVPSARLLDYGCGTGELIEQLSFYGINASGLERSEGARHYASIQYGLNLLADIDEISKDSFDIVTMIEVIEHLTSPYQVLLDIRMRLRPGGRVFITTPNRRGLRARLEGGRWREAQKKFHVVLFDQKSLTKLLGESGYTKIRNIYFPPVQRPGIIGWLVTRLLQLCCIPGTLCMTAQVPR